MRRVARRFSDLVGAVHIRRALRNSEKSVAEYQAWLYRELAARNTGLTPGQSAFLRSLASAATAYQRSVVKKPVPPT